MNDSTENALINKEHFIGLENLIHLCVGGESPMLRSHQKALEKFLCNKASGENARVSQQETYRHSQAKCGELLDVDPAAIAFLGSASEGINLVAYGIDWQPGDNVVIADVEFPSGVYPWARLQELGVEVRVVRHRQWRIDPVDIEQQLDARTRLVLISHVSMFTGQRIDVPKVAAMVHSIDGARFVLDATHAVGVVPVEARHADIVVSSCYKWLLATHGAAVFYWNKESFPELQIPFVGWNSAASSGGWRDPLRFEVHDNADRFVPGNPSYISVAVLDNALDNLLPLGIENIGRHAVSLSGRLWQGLAEQGWDLMTPEADTERAGNVCIRSDHVDEIAAVLRERNILIWGTYGMSDRLRISTHVYNDTEDVDACIDAMRIAKTCVRC